jgi:hypothetical protein
MQMAHGGQRQKPFMAYQETTSVSMVWSNPILFPKPLESDALVTHVDILPTMLDYLGIDARPYKLQGKSYKALFSNPKGSIQDYVLFAFNDHWATFNEQSPPALNMVVNVDSYPIANISNGAMPAPANLWVMNTKTHTVGVYYDQELIPGECFRSMNLYGYRQKYGQKYGQKYESLWLRTEKEVCLVNI